MFIHIGSVIAAEPNVVVLTNITTLQLHILAGYNYSLIFYQN